MCHKNAFYLLIAVSIACLLSGPVAAVAQQVSPGLPELTYHFRKLTQTEGLSSYNVKKIVQDRYGYTWIATQDGLNRFDGKNITIYNHSADTPWRLAGNDIWDIAVDTVHGRLWVLSYTGLNSVDLNTGQVVPNPPALATTAAEFTKGWFTCLQFCGNRLWIGSHYGMFIYSIDQQTFTRFEPIDSLTGGNLEPAIEHFYRDEFDHIWVLIGNYGIVLYSESTGRIIQRRTLEQLGMHPQKDFDRFRAITSLAAGRLAMVTNNGLCDVHYDRYGFRMAPFPLETNAAPLSRKDIFTCTTDRAGHLWFGADNSLYRTDITSGHTVGIKDAEYSDPENWFSNVYCIFIDPYDHLWLGSQKGLALSETTASPFKSWFQSADYSVTINHANFPFSCGDSLLYVCAEDGFYRVVLASNKISRLSKGEFWYAAGLRDGHILVSANDRLYILQDQRLQNIESAYPELAPISTEPIQGLVWCGDSLAVLGSQNSHGIFCWYPKRHALVRINKRSHPLALTSDDVNGLYHDRRGRVWVLSDDACNIFDPAHNTIVSFQIEDPQTHRPLTFFFDVAEAHGLYWLAVYGSGVLAIDSTLKLRRSFTNHDGLANLGVYKVFSWRDSILLVTSNNGLSRIRLTDSSIVTYYQKDGLHGNGFEASSGYFDGRYIYAGGERGVTRIDPGSINIDPSPPPLRIGNIRLQTPSSASELGDISSQILTIPSNVVRAQLTVFTFNYTDDLRTSLSYSIPELKTQWIPLKADRTIDLLGFSPGHYTLLIKATNPNSGVTRQLSVGIDWLPKWYQTLWFKLAVILAAVSLFYVFYRYRISQIRQQQLIRQNISSDLHDDIGSTLNTIGIFAQLARKSPEADPWLKQIETSLGQAAVAVRDMIWVLDDSHDTAYDLLERIRQFAIPVTAAHDIRLEVSTDGSMTVPLLKDEKRNLLLIAKETVNNSIKYAACKNISIRFAFAGKSISLHIEDDGTGFDTDRATNGNGLKNIRRRAEKMHYRVTIDSAPGAGTRIGVVKD